MVKEKSLAELMAEDVGMGMEKFDPKEEAKIGFIKIVQKLSKEVSENGKAIGAIINGATKSTLADEGEAFKFIPLFYFKDYSLWSDEFTLVKRSLNKEDFDPADLRWDEATKTPPKVQEAVNFVILNAADPVQPMILSFSRTNIKIGQNFRTLLMDTMNVQKVPTFGAIYSTRSVEEKKGVYSWHTFSPIKFVAKVEDAELYAKLRGYHKEISELNLGTILAVGSAGATAALPEAKVEIDPNAKY